MRAAVPRLTDDDVVSMRQWHARLGDAMRGDDAKDSFRALNREFHLTLYRASGSPVLLRQIEDLANQADRFRLHFDVRQGPALDGHAEILASRTP